ncbi:MAG: hypothetical protein JXB04_10195, partial [Kiritimatiellae bacterium]|nr:hypothetical protein [Kiritimatiellia bacterium]
MQNVRLCAANSRRNLLANMSKYRVLAAALCMLLPAAPLCAGLLDAGFEWPCVRAWLGPWGGGANGGGGGGQIVEAGPADFIHDSHRAVRLEVWGDGRSSSAAWAGITQVHPCEPGRTIRAAAWVYRSSSVLPLRPGTTARIKLEYCRDGAGNAAIPGASLEGRAFAVAEETPADAWRRIEAEHHAPPGAQSLKVSVVLTGEGLVAEHQAVWVDDLDLDLDGFEPTRPGSERPEPSPMAEPDVRVADGAFQRGDERFWIKGVGYSPFRPGQRPGPGAVPPDDILREDMRRIRAAGFNTLRTWDDMPDRLYEIAEEHGLQVLSGVSVPIGNPAEPASAATAAEWAAYTVGRLRKHPNIIGYLMVNEPSPDVIEEAGEEAMRAWYRSVIAAARGADPVRPIATTPWIVMWFLNMPEWDLLCYNIYNYHPSLITRNMGYARLVDHARRTQAGGRPFVVTEFGYSVSPKGEGRFGYGGNTAEEQARGIADILSWIVAGGAQGACVFEWNDEWWKPLNTPRDEFTHDDDPEEHFGLVEFKGAADKVGSLRPAYDAVRKCFQNLVLSPREGEVIAGDVPVRVYQDGEGEAALYECSLDEADWRPLARAGSWWTAVLEPEELAAGPNTLWVRTKNAGGQVLSNATRRIGFCVAGDRADPTDQSDRSDHELTLEALPLDRRPEEPVRFVVHVRDAAGAPAANVPVGLSVLQVRPEMDVSYFERTDSNGVFSVVYFPPRGGPVSHLMAWAVCDTTRDGCPAYAAADLSLLLAGMPERDRAAHRITFCRAESAPAVDGRLDAAYGGRPSLDLMYHDGVVPEFEVRGRWYGNRDLSAGVYGTWDDEALYLFVEVKDTDPANNRWAKDEIWKGDGLEVHLGTDPAAPAEAYAPTDYQFILAPRDKTWVYGQASGGTRNGPLKDVEMVTLST